MTGITDRDLPRYRRYDSQKGGGSRLETGIPGILSNLRAEILSSKGEYDVRPPAHSIVMRVPAIFIATRRAAGRHVAGSVREFVAIRDLCPTSAWALVWQKKRAAGSGCEIADEIGVFATPR